MSITNNIDDAHSAICDAENLIHALKIIVWEIMNTDDISTTGPEVRALTGVSNALGDLLKDWQTN
ncbi:hypothetical protein [uncultured Roseovarius sp.]|uniref:hypothetical protein n=1 Tax=uncultured Roseovarius sp. TaxID=293344 RepID=UPI002624A4C6|nr:hypothetical protein [uncultured Roseovarius sp.]